MIGTACGKFPRRGSGRAKEKECGKQKKKEGGDQTTRGKKNGLKEIRRPERREQKRARWGGDGVPTRNEKPKIQKRKHDRRRKRKKNPVKSFVLREKTIGERVRKPCNHRETKKGGGKLRKDGVSQSEKKIRESSQMGHKQKFLSPGVTDAHSRKKIGGAVGQNAQRLSSKTKPSKNGIGVCGEVG